MQESAGGSKRVALKVVTLKGQEDGEGVSGKWDSLEF